MNERIRFLTAVLTIGFVSICLELALLLNGGVAELVASMLPLAGWLLAAHDYGFLSAEGNQTAVPDGGTEQRTATAGGGRNRRRTSENEN